MTELTIWHLKCTTHGVLKNQDSYCVRRKGKILDSSVKTSCHKFKGKISVWIHYVVLFFYNYMYFLTGPLKGLDRETNLVETSTPRARKCSWDTISNCKKPASPGEISGSRLGARCILDEPEKILSHQKAERNFTRQYEEAPTGQRREVKHQ